MYLQTSAAVIELAIATFQRIVIPPSKGEIQELRQINPSETILSIATSMQNYIAGFCAHYFCVKHKILFRRY
jgi:hypothetical protein